MALNWLITGGCGFLGTALIRRLLSEEIAASVRVLDNLSVGGRDDLGEVCRFVELDPKNLSQGNVPGVTLVVGDIRDPAVCASCCRGMDVVVHFAANTGVPVSIENPRLDMECNVVGTFNMLEAAREAGVARFVFASSGAPAGEVEPPIHEKLPPHPVSPYGASKLAGEGYCSAYYKSFGLETVALRFGNVYGPGSIHKGSVVARFIKNALAGKHLEIYGDGTQTRDFIYIDDLIDAVVLSATRPGIGGETFQIATSRETTVLEIAEMVSGAMEDQGIGRPEIRMAGPRPGDVKRNFSDTSKAEAMLGWKCRMNLEEGIAETVKFFAIGEDVC